jgi:YD repeat-containing protein
VEIDDLTIAEYAYDAYERRVKKVVNGVTTHFHYDLNGLLISETDGNGNPRIKAASIHSISRPKNDRTLPVQTG